MKTTFSIRSPSIGVLMDERKHNSKWRFVMEMRGIPAMGSRSISARRVEIGREILCTLIMEIKLWALCEISCWYHKTEKMYYVPSQRFQHMKLTVTWTRFILLIIP